jgi:putative thioredoxin
LLSAIEQLQRQYENAFTIAKVNCDNEHQIVQHFEIKSVPTVYMFVNGQGVDGFAGEQSTETINSFIKKHLPDPALKRLKEAQTLFAQGQLEEAKNTILDAYKINPEEIEIKLTLAQIYLALGEFENAKPILMQIPLNEQNIIYHNLMSELAVAEASSQTPEIIALENDLLTATNKHPIQYQLSIHYHDAKRYTEALALLYKLLSEDIGNQNGEAKKKKLTILETINDTKLVAEYRRKLYSLLY